MSFEEIRRIAVKETWEQISRTSHEAETNEISQIQSSTIYATPQAEEMMVKFNMLKSGLKIPPPPHTDTCHCRTSYFWLNPMNVPDQPFDPIDETKRIFLEHCDSSAPLGAFRLTIEVRENMLKETDSEGRVFWLSRYVIVEVVKEWETDYSNDHVLIYGEYAAHPKLAINSLYNTMKEMESLPSTLTIVPTQARHLWSKYCSACALPRCRG